jgi:hypothetical protein
MNDLKLQNRRGGRIIKAMKRIAQILAVATGALAFVPSAFAQGCALCYSSASALGSHAQRSLDIGIAVLLFPSLFLFLGVLVLLLRRAHAATS